MAEPIDSRLIHESRRRCRRVLRGLEDMRSEMREGFAALRAHLATQHADPAFLERRVVALEPDVGRIKRRLELAEEPDG